MLQLRGILLSAGLAVSLSAPALAADKWDMPTPYPDSTFHTVNIREFAKDVEQATGGKLVINVHSAGSLIKHPEIKNAVRSGQAQAGEFFLSTLGNENPIFEADAVPFLATSYTQASSLWQASRPLVEKELAKQRLKVLYAVAWPPQGLYTKTEVKTPGDFKGMKMRSNNPMTERLATLLGGVPTQVQVPDIPQAFATGQVEAMITSPSTGVGSKAWDFVKNYYDVAAWVPKNVVVVNAKAFDALPADVQKAVLDAAARAEKRGWDMSLAEATSMTAELEKNGMAVREASADVSAALLQAGDKLVKEWSAMAGADGEAILKAYKK